MYKQIYVFSFANGRDIIADAEHLISSELYDGAIKVGKLTLPEVFDLTKPRIIMMHQTPKGIQVGMAPVNIDDPDEKEPIPFMRSTLSYCYALPEKSNLATNYIQSVSTIALASNLSDVKPIGSGAFRAG